jgi:adenylosuccinate synthase
MVRKAIQINGISRLALTKLDVLSGLDEIKVCTHYEIDGWRTDQFPSNLQQYERITPVYKIIDGWKSDISGCKSFSELPPEAVNYIKQIRELCYGVPALIVSVGPERSQTIEVDGI